MNANILDFNHEGVQGSKRPLDDFAYLSKVTNTSDNLEVSASPSLSPPDDQKPKAAPKDKNLGKIKGKSAGKDMPKRKRRRYLSGYNFYMKYHRTVTVSPGMTLDILDASLTHEEKLKHVFQVLERDPYRLQSGQKRRHRKSHGAIGFKELTIQVASSWRSLDVSAKRVFEDIARQAKHHAQENDSSSESRRSSFETEPAAQGSNMQAVLEEAPFSTGTTCTGMPSLVHFQSDGSTPSVATRSTAAASAGFVATAPPSLLQHLIIDGNLSASSVTDAASATTTNTVGSSYPHMSGDLFEPAPLTVTSHVPVVTGASSSLNASYNSFSTLEPSQETHPNSSASNTGSNELASFLSRLDWSQL